MLDGFPANAIAITLPIRAIERSVQMNVHSLIAACPRPILTDSEVEGYVRRFLIDWR